VVREPSPVRAGGQCLAGTGALGAAGGPAAPWPLRPVVLEPCVVTLCHRQCLDTHGVLEDHVALPSPPFPFCFAHFIAAVQELVSDICRTMAC